MNEPLEKCFACDRLLLRIHGRHLVDTRDSQLVYVGPECYKRTLDAGEAGYQPPLGGPKLYPLGAGGEIL